MRSFGGPLISSMQILPHEPGYVSTLGIFGNKFSGNILHVSERLVLHQEISNCIAADAIYRSGNSFIRHFVQWTMDAGSTCLIVFSGIEFLNLRDMYSRLTQLKMLVFYYLFNNNGWLHAEHQHNVVTGLHLQSLWIDFTAFCLHYCTLFDTKLMSMMPSFTPREADLFPKDYCVRMSFATIMAQDFEVHFRSTTPFFRLLAVKNLLCRWVLFRDK